MAPTTLRGGIAASAFCLLAACVSTMPGAGFPKQESHAFPPSAPTGMGALFEKASGAEGRSGFHMLSAGLDGLLARVELIDSARHSLDLQYYIFRGDESGLIVAAALLRAADRGVRVRSTGSCDGPPLAPSNARQNHGRGLRQTRSRSSALDQPVPLLAYGQSRHSVIHVRV